MFELELVMLVILIIVWLRIDKLINLITIDKITKQKQDNHKEGV